MFICPHACRSSSGWYIQVYTSCYQPLIHLFSACLHIPQLQFTPERILFSLKRTFFLLPFLLGHWRCRSEPESQSCPGQLPALTHLWWVSQWSALASGSFYCLLPSRACLNACIANLLSITSLSPFLESPSCLWSMWLWNSPALTFIAERIVARCFSKVHILSHHRSVWDCPFQPSPRVHSATPATPTKDHVLPSSLTWPTPRPLGEFPSIFLSSFNTQFKCHFLSTADLTDSLEQNNFKPNFPFVVVIAYIYLLMWLSPPLSS